MAKKRAAQSLEEARQSMVELKKAIGDKKVCLLSDNTNSPRLGKEIRDYAAEVIPQIAKAVAIISGSALGKMSANLFFALKKTTLRGTLF